MAKEAMEAGHTPGAWKSTRAVKASNFGSVASRVTALIPDPAKPGELTSVTIAKVFGGLHDDPKVAEAYAALIVTAVNSHETLVKALQDTERHLAFQHKWLSDQFEAMGRTRDEGTVGADTWEQIEAAYALWKQVKSALASATPHTLIARKAV